MSRAGDCQTEAVVKFELPLGTAFMVRRAWFTTPYTKSCSNLTTNQTDQSHGGLTEGDGRSGHEWHDEWHARMAE